MPQTGGLALLRRMREQKAQQKLTPDQQILVAYASQTGTAHEIAKALHADLAQRTSAKSVLLLPFNDVKIETLRPEKIPVVAFVAASTGDGDPPDNTASFYAKLLRKREDELRGVKYTSLGLGDSNYTRFMAVPRNLRKKFEGLGAECLFWNAEADEVDGLEETVEKWHEGALQAVLKEYARVTGGGGKSGQGTKEAGKSEKYPGLPALLPRRVQFSWREAGKETGEGRSAAAAAATSYVDAGGAYSADKPFYATVRAVERVTPVAYEKQIIHMALDISGSHIEYKPGDAFGVLPENRPDLVAGVLARLGEDGRRVFAASASINAIKAGRPLSVAEALGKHCDLTSPPKKSLLRLLAESCGDPAEKDRLLAMVCTAGKATYKKQVVEGELNLLDILEEFPSCKPGVEDLIEFLPALAPREYSVSSAAEVHANEIHFAFSVVKYETPAGKIRQGVATTWLSTLADRVSAGADVKVPIFMRPSKDFQHPGDLAKPIVMIGPGTGVSPFRGFAHFRGHLIETREESQALQEVGESWLFYGCRDRTKDFLYESDFTVLREAKVLHHYQVAFSREQAAKVYVQDRMQEHAAKLAELIVDKGAYVFVCGDGKHMAKDVQTKLREIVARHGAGMQPEAAEDYLQGMQKNGRYVRDIWS